MTGLGLPTVGYSALLTACLMIWSCSNEAEAFCRDATVQLCARCYRCGSDDQDSSNRCGLAVQTNEEGCRTILRRVCTSDGTTHYNPLDAQRCQESIDALTCAPRRLSPSIRSVCAPFF
jgi:hypothetical protein